MIKTPAIDPASVGVSFVDILFALAVGEVFAPIADWATNPVDHPLPSTNTLQLAVALTLTITSWIGYHASANRARFQVHFFNIELTKLVLDIGMVLIYFILAAYAIRRPTQSKAETSLILISFILYALWDLASVFQKRKKSDNPYRIAWDEAFDAKQVTTPWQPTDYGRIRATWISLAVVAAIWTWNWAFAPSLPARSSRTLDAVLIGMLVGYRFLKEIMSKEAGAEQIAPETPEGSVGDSAGIPAGPA